MAWKAKSEISHQFHIEHPFLALIINFLFGLVCLGTIVVIIVLCWDKIDAWIVIPVGIICLFIFTCVMNVIECIEIIK